MVLKYGRARQAFIEAAKHLVCDACEETQRPKLARPSKPPSTYEFNHTNYRFGHLLHPGPAG